MATIIIPLIFGVLPSIIWLLFYLREDIHPEPKRMVIKVFFYGIIFAFPTAILEILILKLTSNLIITPIFSSIFTYFFVIAPIEEIMKYLVVREKVVSNPEFDEPIDIMLYMIIAALGFAATENIFLLFSLKPEIILGEVIEISILRFLSAIILHALASATIGFFLALSYFETKKRRSFLLLGFLIAIFLHGLYDFSIIEGRGNLKIIVPAFILISLSFFVSASFQRLKKIKSICKI